MTASAVIPGPLTRPTSWSWTVTTNSRKRPRFGGGGGPIGLPTTATPATSALEKRPAAWIVLQLFASPEHTANEIVNESGDGSCRDNTQDIAARCEHQGVPNTGSEADRQENRYSFRACR